MSVWLDGKLHAGTDVGIHPLTHTLHYGTGVFEGIRSYEGSDECAVFRLQDHIRRLIDSAATLGLEIPFDQNTIMQAVITTLTANRLRAAYIRPLVFVGSGSMSLDLQGSSGNPTHLLIAAWEWKSYFDGSLRQGLKVKLGKWRRSFPGLQLNRTKAVGFYVDSYLAHLDARRSGYDEALLLDEAGHVAEATAANLFLVRDDQLFTPIADVALPGITRDSVMALARSLGIHAEERRISPKELASADEAFLTGTACEVVPVTHVNGEVIGRGDVGPVTRWLARSYEDLVHQQLSVRECEGGAWHTCYRLPAPTTNHSEEYIR